MPKDIRDEWRLQSIERDARQGVEAIQLLNSFRGDLEQLARGLNETNSLMEELRYEVGRLQEDNRALNERLEILENKDEI